MVFHGSLNLPAAVTKKRWRTGRQRVMSGRQTVKQKRDTLPRAMSRQRKKPETPAPEDREARPVEAEVIPARKMGRPSKRTPELEAQIAECLRLGMTIPQTCDACGVSQTQFRNWRKHYRDFQELVRRAEAEAVKLNLAVIQAAAASGKSWQAAAWFLERKHPEQWAKTETLSIEARKDAVKEAITINAARTPEHLRELRQALQLEPDAPPALVEAAMEHAKAEQMRREQARLFGIPYEPRPFVGTKDDKQPGVSATPSKVRQMLTGGEADARGEKIAALIELQAKMREVAGKPPLSKADAFEAAARELDGRPA